MAKRTHMLHVDYRPSDIRHCSLCHHDIDFGKVADCRPVQEGCVFEQREEERPMSWRGLLSDRLKRYFS